MAIQATRTTKAISTIHPGECRKACKRDRGGRSTVAEAGGTRTGEVGEGIEGNENCIVRGLWALSYRPLADSNQTSHVLAAKSLKDIIPADSPKAPVPDSGLRASIQIVQLVL